MAPTMFSQPATISTGSRGGGDRGPIFLGGAGAKSIMGHCGHPIIHPSSLTGVNEPGHMRKTMGQFGGGGQGSIDSMGTQLSEEHG